MSHTRLRGSGCYAPYSLFSTDDPTSRPSGGPRISVKDPRRCLPQIDRHDNHVAVLLLISQPLALEAGQPLDPEQAGVMRAADAGVRRATSGLADRSAAF